MRTQKITFLLAGLLLCWGSVLAKYAIEISSGGTLTAIADGNTGPYTFEWRDSNGVILNPTDDSVNELNDLNDGIYFVSIFNGYGCETILEATLGLRVFLEGAFSTSINRMTTTLNTERRLLPGQTPVSPLAVPTLAGQPYNAAPWNYAGTEGAGWTNSDYEADVVDWVLVSVRADIKKSSELEIKAGLLKKDGLIVFPQPFVNLSNIETAYIVVEHRNHLPIMTPAPVSLSDNKLAYDFTLVDSYSTGTGAGQINKNGKWLMISGNGKQSGGTERYDINGNDKITWDVQNGQFDQYFDGDYNLDGDVNGQDKIFWVDHNGKYTNVPQ